MRGDTAFLGVYVPTLVLAVLAAGVISFALARVLTLVGAYRLFAHRPLVDLSIFVLVLAGITLVSSGRAG